jgi:hypothetical protein
MNGSIYFDLPKEYNKLGVKIKNIIIDGNILPEDYYTMVGPYRLNITLFIPTNTKVYADIIY